jgi:hypothetical protein
VTGFTINSISMALGAAPISLAGATLTSSDGGINWTLGGLASKTKTAGTYALTIAPAGITDAANNVLIAHAAFNFVVTAPADTTPPRFALNVTTIIKKTTKAKTFDVVYTDPSKVDLLSLGNQNLKVTGPNHFSASATKVKVVANGDGTSVTVTYSVKAPSGGWTKLVNGTYTIKLQANQVRDKQTPPNIAKAATVGSFIVKIK